MASKKKYALLLTSSYLPNTGGVENSIRHLAEEYEKKGYHVDIVTSISRSDDEEVLSYDKVQGFNIYRYRASSFLTGYLSSYRLLKRLRQQKEYDLVIARSHMLVVVARLSGLNELSYVIPGVVRFQENSDNAKLQNIKSLLRYNFNCLIQSLAFRFSSKLYIFSENMRQQVQSVMPNVEVKKVNPGVSFQRFHAVTPEKKEELRAKYDLSFRGPIALCVGRLVRAKGFDLAIKAMKETEEDLKLVIVGDGQEREELCALVKELGISDRVIFKGKQSLPEDFYKLADVFILSSRYEPFGQVLLEASSCSIPVVALHKDAEVMTATSQVYSEHPELVFFVDDNTPIGLAKGIKAALAAYPDDLESAFISFRNKYSWKSLANQLENEV